MGTRRRNSLVVAAMTLAALLVTGVAGATIGGSQRVVAGDTTTSVDPSATDTTVNTTEPATTEPATTEPATESTGPTTTVTTTTVVSSGPEDGGHGPEGRGRAVHGLCRAFAERAARSGNPQALARLRAAAGGDVAAFCERVLAAWLQHHHGHHDGDHHGKGPRDGRPAHAPGPGTTGTTVTTAPPRTPTTAELGAQAPSGQHHGNGRG
jgi:hypothetical protein